ncbi:nudix domain [Trichoderma arundinaceum]|uniref:Nudix domain n=1 Tax=Trichoderma arundinaceum TaxID=490622 RepID=A0A395NJ63_TRIAR|nr:nudix domain [Trichoderma arundinaceum]
MAPYTYTFVPSLSPLASQSPKSLSANSNPPIDHLMTSVLVLRQPQAQAKPQILLLRRSPTDSYPLKWEAPGGSIDDSDASTLDAAARELWEETALKECHFYASVGTTRDLEDLDQSAVKNWGIGPLEEDAKDVQVEAKSEQEGISTQVKITTFLETKNVWGKITFLATTNNKDDVVIDPEEHIDWGWFTEEEVRMGRAEEGSKVLEFTSQAVWGSLLEGFRVGREMGIIV